MAPASLSFGLDLGATTFTLTTLGITDEIPQLLHSLNNPQYIDTQHNVKLDVAFVILIIFRLDRLITEVIINF